MQQHVFVARLVNKICYSRGKSLVYTDSTSYWAIQYTKNIFLNKTAGSKYISLIFKWSKNLLIYGHDNFAKNKYSLRIESTSKPNSQFQDDPHANTSKKEDQKADLWPP